MKQVEYCPFCGQKGAMQNPDGTYQCYKCNTLFSVAEGKMEDKRTPEEKIQDMFDL